MRYVFVLSLLLTLNDAVVATTLPTATKLLEIRSLPAVRKPASSLLQRLSKGKIIAIGTGVSIVGAAMAAAFGVDVEKAVALGVVTAMTTPVLTFLVPSHLDTMQHLNTFGFFARSIRRRVYYTELHDGKPTLHFGKVKSAELSAGMIVVEASDGRKNKYSKVYFKDIGGISVSDHQDLGKQVRLLTEASSDNDNYLYDLGEVVEVYDNGHYEIEIDHKFSYKSVTIPIDKPYRVFVHASLSLNKGGFEFTDSEVSEASEHVASEEDGHIISAAREVDLTQNEAELEQEPAVE